MNRKIYLFIFTLFVCAGPVFGQGSFIKKGVKIIFPKERPAVSGTLGYAAVHDKMQRDILRDLHGLDAVLKGRARSSLLNWYGSNTQDMPFLLNDTYLPGFEEDWTLALESYANSHSGNNFFEDMQLVLARMYPGGRFTPQYAVSFEDVLSFSRLPSQKGVKLGKEFLAAWQDKNIPAHLPGFAVVRVESNKSRPKDVLILDIEREKVYSLFKSQGRGVAQEFNSRQNAWAWWHKKAAQRLKQQGFVINEKKNLISKDGVFWTNLNDLPNALALLYAWKQGYKVKFKHGLWSGEAVNP